MGDFVVITSKATRARPYLLKAKFECLAWTSRMPQGWSKDSLILVVRDGNGRLRPMPITAGLTRHSCPLCEEVIR